MPTEYKWREVKLFPRKGVDDIPVVDGQRLAESFRIRMQHPSDSGIVTVCSPFPIRVGRGFLLP